MASASGQVALGKKSKKKKRPQFNLKKFLKNKVAFLFDITVIWIIVVAFIGATIFYEPLSNKVILFLSQLDPPMNTLPPKAKLDEKVTVEYKKEKLTIVRINLKNSFLILKETINPSGKNEPKLAGAELDMKVSTKIDGIPWSVESVVDNSDGTLSIIKNNLKDAGKAMVDMLTVRIVSIDNQPVIVKDDKIIPYDQSDKILRWAKYIETASEEYGVAPEVIAAVMEQESGGNPQVVSHAGAIGLMQLMPSTAKWLGVNPYNPEENINGGTKYLSLMLDQFGSLELALAAYNSGPKNVMSGRYLYISETQNYIRNVPRLVLKYKTKFEPFKQ